jgi:hypothetical protein
VDPPVPAALVVARADGQAPEGARRAEPRDDAEFQAPPPSAAGLITPFFPFDRASLDESLGRFLDGLGDEVVPAAARSVTLPYPLAVAAAVVAAEAARRWGRRLAETGAAEEWKKGSPTLHGLS